MIEVEVRGDIEYAIRQLKKKLQMDGIKRELKRREYYEKPSVKKRRKQAEAKRKMHAGHATGSFKDGGDRQADARNYASSPQIKYQITEKQEEYDDEY